MPSQKRLIAGIVTGFLGLLAHTSTAATWHVSPTGDDANDGMTWDTAKQTIQAGVDAAASYDTVLVNDGTYVLTGQVTVSTPIYIRSVNGPDATIVDGNGQVTSNRCFYLGSDCTLDGFTVSNGYAFLVNGAGVYCAADNVVITNCTIVWNKTTEFGGGTYAGILHNCIIYRNSAADGSGVYTGMVNNCTIISNMATRFGGGTCYGIVSNCTIYGNTAGEGGGASYGTINNCVISNNTSKSGGGVYRGIINNCTITGNTSSNEGGGASYSTINNCVISGNNTASSGGGVFGGTINNCTISGNTAVHGGGGAAGSTLNNCTISGNTVSYDGGGANGGTLNNCTITGNTANRRGGGASGSTLNNCTISGNTSYDCGSGAYECTLNNCIVYYNDGDDINGGTVEYTCASDASGGVGNITTAPIFIDQGSGYGTNHVPGNYRVSTGSPCINTGNNTLAPTNVTPLDLDGHWRIWDVKVDMGAYEYGSIPVPLNISASDGIFTNKVLVAWDEVMNASGYQVWRYTNDNSSLAILIGAPNSTTYDDTSAVAGIIYYYWVAATNNKGTTGLSSNDIGWRALMPPQTLTASDGIHTDKVALTWSAAINATGYTVWRNISNDTHSASGLESTLTTNYDDMTCDPGILYYYWVKATNTTGISEFSASDSGWRSIAAEITVQPQSLIRTEGETASMSITATGSEPLCYQWQKDGSDIGGATVTNYTIASVAKSNEGGYRCVVTNIAGAVTSAVATLTVNTLPGIGLSTTLLTYAATYGGSSPTVQTLILTNYGQIAFSYSNAITYGTQASGWFDFAPATGLLAGSASQVFTGAVNSATLAAGVYYATNTVIAPAATNSPQSISVVLTVAKANQTITNFTPTNGSVFSTTSTLGLAAQASSGMAVTFEVASGPGSIIGTNLTFTGYGSVSIRASQTGNANWNPAPDVTNTFNVIKALAGVTLNNLTQTYNGEARIVTATTDPLGLTVEITYDGSSTAPTDVGTYAITGTVNTVMYQGSANGTLTVNKADQAGITFLPTSPQTYNTTNGLSASGGSGEGAWSYSIVSGDGEIITSTNLWMRTGTGTVRVRATKAADANYNEASSEADVIAQKAAQTIDFPNPGTQVETNVLVLSATASSSLGVTFDVDGGPAQITSGTKLSFTSTGTVSVSASQAGDDNWASAGLTNTFNVLAAEVDVPTFNPDGGAYPGSAVTVTVSCATAGATIRYTTNGDDPTELSLGIFSGGTVSVPIPGTLKAKAWKDGMNPSVVKSAAYTAAAMVATPAFNPNGGLQPGSAVTVLVTCATADATIRYTTNGDDPTELSLGIFSGSTVSVPIPGTLKAKAWKTGMLPSAVKSAIYTLLIQPAAPASVSASDGTFTNKITVEWAVAAGATDYLIFRNTSNNSATAEEIGTSSTTTYDDTTAIIGKTYYYWVKAVNAAGASAFSAPDTGYLGVIGPIVTVNNMVGDNIRISAADPVTIAVEMMNLPAEYLGFNVDWWVAAYVHDGRLWFYFDPAFNLMPFDGNLANCHPAYQGALYEVPPQTLVENMLLPPGTYNIWFAVDYPMDGILGLGGANMMSRATIVVE